MKWLRLCVFSILLQGVSLCADSSVLNAVPELVDSIEGRLRRLEQDAGINTLPERTSLIAFGEFLYWKPALDGVAYATTAEQETLPGGGVVYNNYEARTAHFKYSPGFRIGIGVGLPHDHWDLQVQWLRLHTTGHDATHASNRTVFDLIGSIESLGPDYPTQARAHCRLDLDVADLVLGRAFFWSRYFWFHPFVGVRGVWLKADWDIRFSTPGSPVFSKLDVDNHYDAVGFVGGFDSKWNFYKGLGLFSHASVSLVYGKSSEKTKQELDVIPFAEETFRAQHATHPIKAIFDVALGLKWEMVFSGKKSDPHALKTPPQHHVMVWAGYEFFYWPNVTQRTIVQNIRSRDRADLSYQGLIVGARVQY